MGMRRKDFPGWIPAVIPALALALILCIEGAGAQAQETVNETKPAGKDLAIPHSFSGDYPAAMAPAVVPREGMRTIRTASGLTPVGQGASASPLDAGYRIEGLEVRLSHGRAEAAAPGSASKSVTSVFGRPVYGDLDNDGDEDAALILAHNTPGSGTFYYAAASLMVNGRFRGTNAVLLGDRIAPQGVRVHEGVVVVDYADRRPGDAMTVPPSIGKTRRLRVRQGILEEIAPPCP